MTREQILRLIESSSTIYIATSDALPALLDLLTDIAGVISRDDMATLTALGGMLYRAVEAENDVQSALATVMRKAT